MTTSPIERPPKARSSLVTLALFLAVMVASAVGAGLVLRNSAAAPRAPREIPKGDIQVLRGSIPTDHFRAIAIPKCWECNDFSGAIKAKEAAARAGEPYVLVLCGATASTDTSSFGPSWPNIAIVPKGSMMPLKAWRITVKEDGSWVIGGF